MRLTIVVAAAIAATATSFAIAQAGPSGESSQSDRAVVRELQKIKREIAKLNRAVGTSSFNGMRGELRDGLETIDRGITGGSSLDSVVGLLRDICQNTEGSPSSAC